MNLKPKFFKNPYFRLGRAGTRWDAMTGRAQFGTRWDALGRVGEDIPPNYTLINSSFGTRWDALGRL